MDGLVRLATPEHLTIDSLYNYSFFILTIDASNLTHYNIEPHIITFNQK